MILPYVGALDAFLAIVDYLPQPVVSFMSVNLFFFALVAVHRRFLHA